MEGSMVVKVNVSLPEQVLQDIDRAARENHTSRSAFLVLAVKHYLEEKEEAAALERRRKAAEGIDRFREKFGNWDATAELLKWRDRH
ncbi:MAG: 1 protein [Dehalococcoidia bacterium]|nr:1 protein [Dehalococcoidia bacterium]